MKRLPDGNQKAALALNEQFVQPLRASLGDERFAVEWAAGRAEPADQAIESALATIAAATPLVGASA